MFFTVFTHQLAVHSGNVNILYPYIVKPVYIFQPRRIIHLDLYLYNIFEVVILQPPLLMRQPWGFGTTEVNS